MLSTSLRRSLLAVATTAPFVLVPGGPIKEVSSQRVDDSASVNSVRTVTLAESESSLRDGVHAFQASLAQLSASPLFDVKGTLVNLRSASPDLIVDLQSGLQAASIENTFMAVDAKPGPETRAATKIVTGMFYGNASTVVTAELCHDLAKMRLAKALVENVPNYASPWDSRYAGKYGYVESLAGKHHQLNPQDTDQVFLLQASLMALGYKITLGNPNQQTWTALRSFQTAANITPDTIVGPQTAAMLKQKLEQATKNGRWK